MAATSEPASGSVMANKPMDSPLNSRGQILFLLLVVAELEERDRRTGLHVQVDPDGAMDAGDLLGDQRMGEKAQAVAAVFLWNQTAVKAQLAHFGDEIFAKDMFPIVLGGSRSDFLFAEVARQFLHFG